MSKITGQVYRLFDKEFRGKTLWSFRLENDPVYYRMNENRGAGIVEPGNYIEFEADPNSDGKSAQVKGQPKRVEAAPKAASGANYSGGSNANREASIHYQSARKDALTFVGLAVTSGAIALPSKTAAKLEALEALVDSYTAQYVEDISTGGAVTRTTERAYAEEAEQEAPKPSAKKARPPVEDDDDSDDE